MKPLKYISAGFLFFILLAGLLAGVAYYDALRPLATSRAKVQPVEFTVQQGMGPNAIGESLEANKLIRSKFAFVVHTILSGKRSFFKPGVYILRADESVIEIADILTAGPQEIEAIIVPGMTLLEVEDMLVSKRIVEPGVLVRFPVDSVRSAHPLLGNVTRLEGFLYPDTYRFYPHSDPKVVVEKILANFDTKVGPLLTDLRSSKDYDTIHWLILASILEKEIVNISESQTVAGILEKRLAIGMPLQVDASIIYAKCGRFLSCSSLSRSDFKIDSPFNTYRYKGLPPTPISNPGIDAISAALHPVRSAYLYYLSDPKTKKTIFSRSLDEQNANRIKYLSK